MGRPPTRVQRARTDARRAEIVTFVEGFHREHGYGPSLRQVADAIGLGLSSTTYHVGQLAARGVLVSEPHTPRSLRVVEVHSREPL
jgi:repressor LexA